MKRLLTVILYLVISNWACAQQSLQSYTPSILFEKGEWEFKSFQNLYTQTKSFGDEGKVSDKNRSSYFTSINQMLFGINGQLNIGFDVWVKNVTLENGNPKSRTSISSFGPKIKVAPFKNLERLSIQSSLLFPMTKDMEGRDPATEKRLFLDHDRTLWLTQFYYDYPISAKLQLFFQQAFWYSIVRDSYRENNYLETQTSVFLSFFPNSRWTIYGMTEYFPTHYNASFDAQEWSAFYEYFVQSGVGIKYQAIPNLLEFELLYTDFWAGSDSKGAGQTFNLGIRLIRQ